MRLDDSGMIKYQPIGWLPFIAILVVIMVINAPPIHG